MDHFLVSTVDRCVCVCVCVVQCVCVCEAVCVCVVQQIFMYLVFTMFSVLFPAFAFINLFKGLPKCL